MNVLLVIPLSFVILSLLAIVLGVIQTIRLNKEKVLVEKENVNKSNSPYACCHDCIGLCGYANLELCPTVSAEVKLRKAKPCPVCGSVDILALSDEDFREDVVGSWVICCQDCSAQTNNYLTEEQAIEA